MKMIVSRLQRLEQRFAPPAPATPTYGVSMIFKSPGQAPSGIETATWDGPA